jgi:hypothetical protein
LGYYGGITEVYKPFGSNLYYYDVNSLYPFVSLQDLPGTEGYKVSYYKGTKLTNDLFGFYYAKIETTKDGYFGMLPVRYPEGIKFPLGK